MERRDFLKILPISAVAPKIISEGVASFELPGAGHYVIVVDQEKIDIDELVQMPGILPKGATGGWIIIARGNPDDAIKFYKLEEPNVCVQP